MADKMKCTECEHCRGSKGRYAERSGFHCEHPNHEYVANYFKEHKIQKMTGFIGFGAVYADKPNIKTSPAWCPRKAGGK